MEKFGLNSERLNLVLAVCAILISGASFYATYLQAESAENQVRAMTLPLVRFEHSNFDSELNERAVTFSLNNSGVGPAIVQGVEFVYGESRHSSLPALYRACCEMEYESYQQFQSEMLSRESVDILDGGMFTRPIDEFVIPGQSEYQFLGLYRATGNSAFWDKLDQIRWRLGISICYCSMLGDCFEHDGENRSIEIPSCDAF